MTHTSARMGHFRPSATTSMGALVRKLRSEGRDIIGLVGGEPDFGTPEPVKQAGIKTIIADKVRYTDVEGSPNLRKALSLKFKRDNGLSYPPEQIVASSGMKPLIHAAIIAMTDPGDEVIIPAPYWVSHVDIAQIAGAVPVTIPCPPETGFRLGPQQLEAAITPRTRVLLLSSPNNPTGTAYSKEELEDLIAVLKRHPDIWVVTDEIYEHLCFDGRHAPSMAAVDPQFAERVVTINGLSKGYTMTGWRMGFAGGPPTIMKAIGALVGQLVGSPNAITQDAAIEAVTGDQSFMERNRKTFQARRDLTVQALQQMPGLSCHAPDGAFYVYVDCSGLMGRALPSGEVIKSDDDFVRGAIEHAGVALLPGSVFGLSPYFRISYPGDTAELKTALDRLRQYCNALH